MQWLSIETIDVGECTKTAVRAIHIANKLRLGEFTFICEARICRFPVAATNLQKQVTHCRVGRIFRHHHASLGIHGRGARLIWPRRADCNQRNRRHHESRTQQPTSLLHEINLPRTRSSRFPIGAGRSATLLVAEARAGIKSSTRENRLLPIGKVPHSNPSQGCGRWGESMAAAGGTDSLLQIVIVLFSRSSTFRQPEKTSSGS